MASKEISNKKIICCVDGNIGTGKSTLLKNLEQKGYYVFQEDLSDWGELLNRFYSNQKRWMCTLQVSIIHSMHQQYQQIQKLPHDVIFVERSPQSSMIFVKNGIRQGFLDSEENRVIQNLYNEWKWIPDISFYVDTPVEICHERILNRKRECEDGIGLDYLKFLHDEYASFYSEAVECHSKFKRTAERATQQYRLDGTLNTSILSDSICSKISQK